MTNAEVRAFLPALCHAEAGGVTEVCVFQGGKKPTHVGFFDDPDKAAKAIEAHDRRGNIFVTLNPAKRSLLARCNNSLVEGTYKNPAQRTKDTEIHLDCWFPFDVDPERPSGISSTDEEKSAALDVAKAVRDWLLSAGVPSSSLMTCDSGNGAYVLVRTPDCKVTDEHTALKKAFLNFVADKFDAGRVKIDRTVYNPARLIGALGAMKVKGENIPERPHRRSTVRTVAGEPFDPTKAQRCEPFDLYALAKKILPPAEEKKTKQTSSNKSASGDYTGFDARKIAHLLENHKPTSNGFDRYDCPNCKSTQKFWVQADNGKHGCYEPDSVCDWRQLRDKVREMARENGIEAKTEKPAKPSGPYATVKMSSVKAEKVEWLWKPYLPIGKITLLDGWPGIGKSWLTCMLAAIVTRGGGFPNSTPFERGNVLMFSAEDGLADTLRPRLDACGADVDRVMALNFMEKDGLAIFNQDGLARFEETIVEHNAMLVIVDPLFAFTGGSMDINRANECREVSRTLAAIAARRRCNMLCVRHFGKSGGGGDPMKAGIGSIDWLAAARVGLIVGCDPDDKDKRALTCYKSNIGPLGKSLGYKITFDNDTDTGSFEWVGESDLTAERILTPARQESADDLEQKTDAVSFLKQLLDAGRQEAKYVEDGRRAASISDRALRMAKTKLGVNVYKEGGEFGGKGAKWYWELPADEGEEYPPTRPTQGDHPGESAPQGVHKAESDRLVANGSGKSSYSNGLPQGDQTPTYGHVVGEPSTPCEVNGSNNPPTLAADGVPFMITSEMRRQLYKLNYGGPDINGMTPEAAWDLINSGLGKGES